MSRRLEPALPAAFARTIRGEPDPDAGFTILVLSTTDEGWPHAAMISVGEIVTAGERRVLVALWPGSTTTANLSPSARATLLAVVDGTPYSVRLSMRRLPDLTTNSGGTFACFEGVVDAASSDEAPYAILESGVTFRLTNRDGTMARWRETRLALKRRAHDS